jgi:hypothetical protein
MTVGAGKPDRRAEEPVEAASRRYLVRFSLLLWTVQELHMAFLNQYFVSAGLHLPSLR